MTTENTNHSLNTFPFLSEEMERTLRLRAWKDEIFREALIADPKGVLQRLFPQCFPNGKLPEQLTINVIEEDPGTCHIVLPPLPDESPTLEIPEEEQLELLANMSVDRKLGGRDSSEKSGSQPHEQRNPSFLELEYKSTRRQQAAENKENTPASGDHHDSWESAKPPTREELQRVISQNREFLKELQNLGGEDQNRAIQTYLKEHFRNRELPKDVTFNVIQDTQNTHHIPIQRLLDASHDSAVPEVKLGLEQKTGEYTRCCMTGYVCH